MITQLHLRKICPNVTYADKWCHFFNEHFFINEFSNVDIAMFIAQCAHESGEFNTLQENLNYSAERLLVVFPKYFTEETALKFHRRPQDIANTVYANRMGNGNFASGDGFKYRGRGIIQNTGKGSYALCGKEVFGNERVLLDNPDVLLTFEGATKAAFWYWMRNKIQGCGTDVECATRKINNGLNGIADRKKYFERAMMVI